MSDVSVLVPESVTNIHRERIRQLGKSRLSDSSGASLFRRGGLILMHMKPIIIHMEPSVRMLTELNLSARLTKGWSEPIRRHFHISAIYYIPALISQIHSLRQHTSESVASTYTYLRSLWSTIITHVDRARVFPI